MILCLSGVIMQILSVRYKVGFADVYDLSSLRFFEIRLVTSLDSKGTYCIRCRQYRFKLKMIHE